MSIKDPLVHLTSEAAARSTGSLPYVISMAERLGAHLTALVFAVDFTKPATFYGGATDEDIAEAHVGFAAKRKRQRQHSLGTPLAPGFRMRLRRRNRLPPALPGS